MPLDQWFSKWGSWASSVNITWELVRRKFSSCPSHLLSQSPPGNSSTIHSLRNTGMDSELLWGWEPYFSLPQYLAQCLAFSRHQLIFVGRMVGEWMNARLFICLNLSLYVLHTISASAGIRVLPRTVPGPAGMPGGSKWDLLWRPVPHPGQLPLGAIPVSGRWVPSLPWRGNSLLIFTTGPAPSEQRESSYLGVNLLCAKRLPNPKLLSCGLL